MAADAPSNKSDPRVRSHLHNEGRLKAPLRRKGGLKTALYTVAGAGLKTGGYLLLISVKPAAGPKSVPIGPNDILCPPGIVTVRPATMPSAAPKVTSLR